MSEEKAATFISSAITGEDSSDLKEVPQSDSNPMFQRKPELAQPEPIGNIIEDNAEEEEEEEEQPELDLNIPEAPIAPVARTPPQSPKPKSPERLEKPSPQKKEEKEPEVQKEEEEKKVERPIAFERPWRGKPHAKTPARRHPLVASTKATAQTPGPSPVQKRQENPEPPLEKPAPQKRAPTKKGNGSILWVVLFLCVLGFVGLRRMSARKMSAFERTEADITRKLNDCIYPCRNVSIHGIDFEFVNDVIAGKSEYLAVSGTYLIVKKPKKTMLCRTLEFGDRHPNLAGLILVWAFTVMMYVFSVYHRAKANRLVPSVLEIIRTSKGKMVFIDDVMSEMQKRGVSRFTWNQIVNQINRNSAVQTVHVEYSKPFWSLQD